MRRAGGKPCSNTTGNWRVVPFEPSVRSGVSMGDESISLKLKFAIGELFSWFSMGNDNRMAAGCEVDDLLYYPTGL